jgi:hypothetical protein
MIISKHNRNISLKYKFQHRVLMRMFGPKWEKVIQEWRKQHNEELNYLYCSPNIVRVTKHRRMRWAGHVAHMEEREQDNRYKQHSFYINRTM